MTTPKPLFIAVLICLMGCHAPQKAVKGDTIATPPVPEEGPRMAFVCFKASRDSLSPKTHVVLKSATSMFGTFKKNNPVPDGPDYLTVYLYADKTLKDSFRIDHPLYRRVEAPGAYGNNPPVSKQAVLDSAEFCVRVNLTNGVSKLKLKETRVYGASYDLGEYKLPGQ